VRYITEYLSSVREAMDDGVNVIGYTVWSLMDNFEWSQGYTARFGMIHVDFNSEERTRTRKQSFYCYKAIIEANSIVEDPVNCPRDIASMWIDQEPLKLQAKLFGISSAEDAENLIRAAYKQFIRFNNVAAIRQEDDGYVVEIWFIKDNHSTSNTQILNEFRSYFYDNCVSAYSTDSCDEAFGAIPSRTTQEGAPTIYNVDDESTTTAPKTTSTTSTTAAATSTSPVTIPESTSSDPVNPTSPTSPTTSSATPSASTSASSTEASTTTSPTTAIDDSSIVRASLLLLALAQLVL